MAWHLQHCRGSRSSLRRSRKAHPRRQGQAQLSPPTDTAKNEGCSPANAGPTSQEALRSIRSRDGSHELRTHPVSLLLHR
uniref:Uncharacterized protein n=1 Tax=Rhizophora mucronata TaxID=61149 RepID=A0A2P2NRM4_RHIMU